MFGELWKKRGNTHTARSLLKILRIAIVQRECLLKLSCLPRPLAHNISFSDALTSVFRTWKISAGVLREKGYVKLLRYHCAHFTCSVLPKEICKTDSCQKRMLSTFSKYPTHLYNSSTTSVKLMLWETLLLGFRGISYYLDGREMVVQEEKSFRSSRSLQSAKLRKAN